MDETKKTIRAMYTANQTVEARGKDPNWWYLWAANFTLSGTNMTIFINSYFRQHPTAKMGYEDYKDEV